jgi:hypothetical protein
MMPPQMTRRTRRNLTLVLSAFCLVALCLYKGTSPNDKAMVFALSVQAPNGDLLASPVVVGAAGQKVQVHLVCEKDPRAERMSLTLDPMGVEDGDLLYSYELSVAGRVQAEHGTVKLAVGRERKINVRREVPVAAEGLAPSARRDLIGARYVTVPIAARKTPWYPCCRP